MRKSQLSHLRSIVLALPEVSERVSHGAPCFYIQDKRALCRYHDHHYGDDRVSLWCPATPELKEELVATEPELFFKPPASASGVFSDWLGVYLDTGGENTIHWNRIAAILEQAYRKVAPNWLVNELDIR